MAIKTITETINKTNTGKTDNNKSIKMTGKNAGLSYAHPKTADNENIGNFFNLFKKQKSAQDIAYEESKKREQQIVSSPDWYIGESLSLMDPNDPSYAPLKARYDETVNAFNKEREIQKGIEADRGTDKALNKLSKKGTITNNDVVTNGKLVDLDTQHNDVTNDKKSSQTRANKLFEELQKYGQVSITELQDYGDAIFKNSSEEAKATYAEWKKENEKINSLAEQAKKLEDKQLYQQTYVDKQKWEEAKNLKENKDAFEDTLRAQGANESQIAEIDQAIEDNYNERLDYTASYDNNAVENVAYKTTAKFENIVASVGEIGKFIVNDAERRRYEAMAKDALKHDRVEDYNELIEKSKEIYAKMSNANNEQSFTNDLAREAQKLQSYGETGETRGEKFITDSIAQMVENATLQFGGGLLGQALGSAKVGVGIGTALMSTEGFKNTVDQNLANGFSVEQAYANAGLKAGIEFMTEKIGGERILGMVENNSTVDLFLTNLFANATENAFKSGVAESAEETLSWALEPIADAVTLGTPISVDSYNPEELGMAVAQAFVTGALMDSVGNAKNYYAQFFNVTSEGGMTKVEACLDRLNQLKSEINLNEPIIFGDGTTMTTGQYIDMITQVGSESVYGYQSKSVLASGVKIIDPKANNEVGSFFHDLRQKSFEALQPTFAQEVKNTSDIVELGNSVMDISQALLEQKGVNMPVNEFVDLSPTERQKVLEEHQTYKDALPNTNIMYTTNLTDAEGNAVNGAFKAVDKNTGETLALVDKKTGDIYVDPRGDVPAVVTAVHEVIHSIEGTQEHSNMYGYAFTNAEDLENKKTELGKDRYKGANNRTLTSEALTTRITEELMNEEDAKKLIDHLAKYNTSTAYKLLYKLENLTGIAKDNSTLGRITNELTNALEKQDTIYLEDGTKFSKAGTTKKQIRNLYSSIEKEGKNTNEFLIPLTEISTNEKGRGSLTQTRWQKDLNFSPYVNAMETGALANTQYDKNNPSTSIFKDSEHTNYNKNPIDRNIMENLDIFYADPYGVFEGTKPKTIMIVLKATDTKGFPIILTQDLNYYDKQGVAKKYDYLDYDLNQKHEKVNRGTSIYGKNGIDGKIVVADWLKSFNMLWGENGQSKNAVLNSVRQLQLLSTGKTRIDDSITPELEKSRKLDIFEQKFPKLERNSIKTFDEVTNKDNTNISSEDFNEDAIKEVKEKGFVKVYSLSPIVDTSMVSPSKSFIEEKANGKQIYSSYVKLDDVAWSTSQKGYVAFVPATQDIEIDTEKLDAQREKQGDNSQAKVIGTNLLDLNGDVLREKTSNDLLREASILENSKDLNDRVNASRRYQELVRRIRYENNTGSPFYSLKSDAIKNNPAISKIMERVNAISDSIPSTTKFGENSNSDEAETMKEDWKANNVNVKALAGTHTDNYGGEETIPKLDYRPKMTFVIGLPGGGKSVALEGENAIQLDNDEVKFVHPMYREYKGIVSGAIHEESSQIMKELIEEYYPAGLTVDEMAERGIPVYNLAMPKIFGGEDRTKLKAEIDKARNKGYDVSVKLVDISNEESQVRNASRFADDDGRFIPSEKIVGYGDNPYSNFISAYEELQKEGIEDVEFKRYENGKETSIYRNARSASVRGETTDKGNKGGNLENALPGEGRDDFGLYSRSREGIGENVSESTTVGTDLADKNVSSLYEERNKLSEGASNELRNLQRDGIQELNQSGWGRRSKALDGTLRERLSNVLKGELERRGYNNRNDNGLLKNTGEFKIIKDVDGETFHDVFSTARTFLNKGELVDVHPIETDENWTGYNDCKNYLSEDGTSGFSITKDGDLISVFNVGGKKGFLRSIAPFIKENAKTLDCYVLDPSYTGTNLQELYRRAFGFEIKSTDTYNWDYDHDGIGTNYKEPKIAYMYNPLNVSYSRKKSTQVSPVQDNNQYYDYGMRPVRQVDIPIQTEKGRTTKSARTLANSQYVSDEVAEQIRVDSENGKNTYKQTTRKEEKAQALAKIKQFGSIDKAIDYVVKDYDVRNMKVNVVMASELIAELERQGKGQSEQAIKLRKKVMETAPFLGQAVEAYKTYKDSDPQTKLITIQDTIRAINEELKTRYGNRAPNVSITEELIRDFENAKTDAERTEVEDRIAQHVADQIPPTLVERMNAWRHLSMLFNPKTWVKNRVANTIFGAVTDLSRDVQTGVEKFLEKKGTIKQGGREAGIYNPLNADERKAYKILQKKYLDTHSSFQSKYSKGDIGTALTGNAFADKVESKRKQFKSKTLNALERVNGKMMSDAPAMKKAYAKAYIGYCKSNGLSLTEDNPNIDDYAFNKAREVTFNAESELANKIGQFAKTNTATKLVVDSFIPFKRTPINILKQGVKFSPVGLVSTITKGTYDVQKGTISPTQFADNLASGLTGSALTIMGALLAHMGLFRTKDDDKDRKQYFDEDLGEQDFALTIGDYTYTLDWADPLIMPMAMGAEIYNTVSDKEGGIDNVDDIVSLCVSIGDPIFETSMLSGVTKNLNTGYGTPFEKAGKVVENTLSNYASQYVPSVGGAIARTIDDTRRSTYPNNGTVDKFVKTAKNKIPGYNNVFDYMKANGINVPNALKSNEPYINRKGEVAKNQGNNIVDRAILNLVSPGYLNKNKADEYDKETTRLFEETGDLNAFPSNSSSSLTFDKTKYDFTPEEYTEWNKYRWSTEKEYVDGFMDTKEYKSMSDEEKVSTIDKIRDYAGLLAKKNFLDNKGVNKNTEQYQDLVNQISKVKDAEEYGATIYDYLDAKGYFSGLESETKKSDYIDYLNDKNMSDSAKNYMYSLQYGDSKAYKAIEDSGLNDKQKLSVYEVMSKTTSDKDEDGKTISNSKSEKVKAQYQELGIYDKIVTYCQDNDIEYTTFGLSKTVVEGKKTTTKSSNKSSSKSSSKSNTSVSSKSSSNSKYTYEGKKGSSIGTAKIPKQQKADSFKRAYASVFGNSSKAKSSATEHITCPRCGNKVIPIAGKCPVCGASI